MAETQWSPKIPTKDSGDCEERKLAVRFEKLLLRRDKALGTEPSRSQLSPSEVALVNSVPGVPLRGCSATASCSSTVAQQLPESAAIEGARHALANSVRGAESQNLLPCSVGIHHAADPQFHKLGRWRLVFRQRGRTVTRLWYCLHGRDFILPAGRFALSKKYVAKTKRS